eukprot:UN29488
MFYSGMYGSESWWTLSEGDGTQGCGEEGYPDNQENDVTGCCLPAGTYDLYCGDTYGDGWNGGVIAIQGNLYCNGFAGQSDTESVTIEFPDDGTDHFDFGSNLPEPGTYNFEDCMNPGGAPRIVGGGDAKEREYDFIVALMENGSQFCGGSLITDHHVLTAAHCVYGSTAWSASTIYVRIGEYDFATNTDGTHHDINVVAIYVDPDYDDGTLDNDFAILTLASKVPWGESGWEYVRGPVCLDMRTNDGVNEDDDIIGKHARVIGWGTLSSGGSSPSKLQEVEVILLSNQQCENAYEHEIESSANSKICAADTSTFVPRRFWRSSIFGS